MQKTKKEIQNKLSSEKNVHRGEVPREELHVREGQREMYTPQVEFSTNQWGSDSKDNSTNRTRTNRIDALDMIKTNEVSLLESINDTMGSRLKNINALHVQSGVGASEGDKPNLIESMQDRIVNPEPATDIHNNILNLYNSDYRV